MKTLLAAILVLILPIMAFADGNFFDLVKTGTAAQVQTALKAGKVDLTAREDSDNKTPLLWAASYNPDVGVLKALLKAGADPKDVDKEESTLLMDAAMENPNPDVVAAILKLMGETKAANIKAHDLNGMTALTFAALNPNEGVIALLLKGSDLEAMSNGKDRTHGTALIWAAKVNNNPKIIKLLLDAGANIEATDEDGSTPLMYAATFNKNPEIIAALATKANIEALDNEGYTALLDAIGNDNVPEVIQALINARANVNVSEKDGMTPLMVAASLSKHPETLPILIKANADLDAVDNEGNTALMYAAGVGINPDAIGILLDAGANAALKNKKGSMAIDLADAAGKPKDTASYQRLEQATPQIGILTVENKTAYSINIMVDGLSVGTVMPFDTGEFPGIAGGSHSLHGIYQPDSNRGNWGPRTITMDRTGWTWTLTATTMTVTNKSNATANVYLDNSLIATLAPGGQTIVNVSAGDHSGYAQGSNIIWGPTTLHFETEHNYNWNLLPPN